PLAAAALREHRLRTHVPDREGREVPPPDPCGIPERFQSHVLLIAVDWSWFCRSNRDHHHAHGPREHLERHPRTAILRLRVCELGKRRLLQRSRHRGGTAKRPACCAVPVLVL